MPQKQQVEFQGIRRNAIRVEVEETTERWCSAKLSDGSIIKLKAIITDVGRLENTFDNNGDPVYVVKSSNVLAVEANEDLRQKVH
ncbi:MAG: hypothetical protein OXN96_01545 [Bryobacterales bacterium]|nr:hypothetical protein [Bryobacterales bacterium]